MTTHTIGQLILIISGIFLAYYTLWVVSLPFADPEDFYTRLFPSPRLAIVVPACCGLVFISSLALFSIGCIYHS